MTSVFGYFFHGAELDLVEQSAPKHPLLRCCFCCDSCGHCQHRPAILSSSPFHVRSFARALLLHPEPFQFHGTYHVPHLPVSFPCGRDDVGRVAWRAKAAASCDVLRRPLFHRGATAALLDGSMLPPAGRPAGGARRAEAPAVLALLRRVEPGSGPCDSTLAMAFNDSIWAQRRHCVGLIALASRPAHKVTQSRLLVIGLNFCWSNLKRYHVLLR